MDDYGDDWYDHIKTKRLIAAVKARLEEVSSAIVLNAGTQDLEQLRFQAGVHRGWSEVWSFLQSHTRSEKDEQARGKG